MKRKFDFEETIARYSEMSGLDLQYYGLKGYGIDDPKIHLGHPKFHLLNEHFLYSVVSLISESESPYLFSEPNLTLNGTQLGLRIKYIGRVNRPLSYFYYRGIQEWIPTLDAETILSLNFHSQCSGCNFCSRCGEAFTKNMTPQQGIELVVREGVNLQEVDKITIVTGLFRNEKDVIDHIVGVRGVALSYGFRGRILYIGSQIRTRSGIKRLLEGLEGTAFKYAYTSETFTNRNAMHPFKRVTMDEVVNDLTTLREENVGELEYSYIPGIDPLDEFYKWAKILASIARPHISILRPATEEQKGLRHPEFFEDPVGYLIKMRLFFEELYGGPIYANNLANLWPFPVNRLNPLLLTDRTSSEEKF